MEETKTGKTEKKVYCRECFDLKDLPGDAAEAMIAMTLQYCGECYFWHKFEVLKATPEMARIGGKHYFIGPELSLDELPLKDRGMNGGKVIIRFFDGREVTSTNIWFQGLIPERWRIRLYDNAEFVKQ